MMLRPTTCQHPKISVVVCQAALLVCCQMASNSRRIIFRGVFPLFRRTTTAFLCRLAGRIQDVPWYVLLNSFAKPLLCLPHVPALALPALERVNQIALLVGGKTSSRKQNMSLRLRPAACVLLSLLAFLSQRHLYGLRAKFPLQTHIQTNKEKRSVWAGFRDSQNKKQKKGDHWSARHLDIRNSARTKNLVWIRVRFPQSALCPPQADVCSFFKLLLAADCKDGGLRITRGLYRNRPFAWHHAAYSNTLADHSCIKLYVNIQVDWSGVPLNRL